MTKTVYHALAYVEKGYPVLPCQPLGKPPLGKLVPRGLKGASLDPNQVKEWWRLEPRANLGILPPPGVLVLDFDDPKVYKAYAPLIGHAPRQKTPRGGHHVFLRLPPDLTLSASIHFLPGVDLRGMGRAYLLSAPSRTPQGSYIWEVPLLPPEELPPLPEPLLDQLPRVRSADEPQEVAFTHFILTELGKGKAARLLRRACEQVAEAQVGERHNTLIRYSRLVGGLLSMGLDPLEAEEALVAAAGAAGLPEREARPAVRWGLEVGKDAPLSLSLPRWGSARRLYEARRAQHLRR